MTEALRNEFIIDDGSETYVFKNNIGEVFATLTYNPSDTGILARFKTMSAFFNDYKLPELDASDDDVIESLISLDNVFVEQIGKVIGKNVEDSLFGRYKPTTLFANGDTWGEIVIDKLAVLLGEKVDARYKAKFDKVKQLSAKNRR